MSTYVEASRVLTVVASVGMVYALYAQGYKIWKRKSAKDIHLAIAIVPLISEIFWLNYGFAIWEWPIMLICGVNVSACILITVGYFKFRERTPSQEAVEGGPGSQ